jgi:hypothetical protein
MTVAAWPFLDPRMDRERVVRIAYLAARLGYFWVADAAFMFFKRPNTARLYVASLARRGILDAFPRRNPSDPHVYRISERGLEWLADEVGCDRAELWRPTTMRRQLNVVQVRAVNRFWCSLAAAAAKHPHIRLHRFVPERQLRRMKVPSCPVVPDAVAVLRPAADGGADAVAGILVVAALEQDSGYERLKVWTEKTHGYLRAKRSSAFYGYRSRDLVLLAVVPSRRRAVNVARAVAAAGGGSFAYLGVAAELEGGRALDAALWSAAALSTDPHASPDFPLSSIVQAAARTPSAMPIRPDGDCGQISQGIP